MSNIIVMAVSRRNIIGCLLKKRLTKGGGGVTGTPGPPLAMPLPSQVTPQHFAGTHYTPGWRGAL